MIPLTHLAEEFEGKLEQGVNSDRFWMTLPRGDRIEFHRDIPYVTINGRPYRTSVPSRLIEDTFWIPAEVKDWVRDLLPKRLPAAPPKRRLRLVVLDAGHGGHDCGALGFRGTQEKEIALDITLRTEKLIRQQQGIETLMPRRDDRFIPLSERARIANDARADLFVSIHANAHDLQEVHGVETYYPTSTFRSSSPPHMSKEMSPQEVFLKRWVDLRLKGVLFDLRAEEYQHQSEEAARFVQEALTRNLPVKDNQHKQHPKELVVLRETICPAILVETGYLTNPEEELKLNDPDYRQRVAEAIAEGIRRFRERFDQTSGFSL
jgi:N-acetylmuramoyl-L-alanine amidase